MTDKYTEETLTPEETIVQSKEKEKKPIKESIAKKAYKALLERAIKKFEKKAYKKVWTRRSPQRKEAAEFFDLPTGEEEGEYRPTITRNRKAYRNLKQRIR